MQELTLEQSDLQHHRILKPKVTIKITKRSGCQLMLFYTSGANDGPNECLSTVVQYFRKSRGKVFTKIL